jgi:Holliday junction DNA helicase RuvA
MIARISGQLIEKRKNSVLLSVCGLAYEVFLPLVTLGRIDEFTKGDAQLDLVTYHYHAVEPSRSVPVLIGFANDLEKDFFEVFITVSGIGPKAALRALNTSIKTIAEAIDEGNAEFLRSLPGIGPQRAKEIIAKLQGKIGRFGLIQDAQGQGSSGAKKDLIEEAIDVLMQLQYKRTEARDMVSAAVKKDPDLSSVEEILNTVYKQRSNK